VAHLLLGFQRYGLLGGAVVAGAVRHGDRPVMIDERGALSYHELDERTNALANAWRDRGLEAGEGVAILARNHRGFLEAVFAAAKCGARIVLLNTSFAGPQIREVAQREGTDLLVYDDEYSDTLRGIDDPPRGRFRAWADAPGDDTLDTLIEGADAGRPSPRKGRGSPS
jgi:fatty-acyl-CoA synthase